MKKQGSTIEFTHQRNDELVSAFRQAMHVCGNIDIKALAAKIVKMPCSRFWVSEERAAGVIYNMRRGRPLDPKMFEAKQRMYREINRRVADLEKQRPQAPVSALVAEVIYTPAPEFYLNSATAVTAFYRHRRRGRRPDAMAKA